MRYIFCDQCKPSVKVSVEVTDTMPIHEPFTDGHLAYSPVSEHPWIVDTTLTIPIRGPSTDEHLAYPPSVRVSVDGCLVETVMG